VLRTIDDKVVVRPEATVENTTIEFTNLLLTLDQRGRDAWNNGEEIHWWHGCWMDKKCLALLD